MPKPKNSFANLLHRISSKIHWQGGYLALAMAFNLLLSNLTAVAKAKKSLCQWNSCGYFFQFPTKSHKVEPRPKVAKLFHQWLGGDRLWVKSCKPTIVMKNTWPLNINLWLKLITWDVRPNEWGLKKLSWERIHMKFNTHKFPKAVSRHKKVNFFCQALFLRLSSVSLPETKHQQTWIIFGEVYFISK